ncbi:MAG: ABC transporter ATP-binding protein/permease [Oscillospiraceae bacterium]|jgi:ATP-binding cassette subfamily B protein|nr:ABC transporter ATP-binding protein/permease [Oscillospiraceae bacterium]
MKIKNSKQRLKKLISYYKPYKKMFFSYLFMSLMSGLISISIPAMMRYVTNNAINFEYTAAVKTILILFGAAIIMLILQYGCNYYVMFTGSLMGANIENDMRNEIFRTYQTLSHKFFDKNETGELMSRITTDLNNLSKFLHRFPEEIFFFVVRFAGVLAVLCWINWKLAIVATMLVPIVCVYILWFMPKLTKAFEKNFKKLAIVNARIENSLAGIRATKSFTNENLEIQKFEDSNQNFVSSQRESFKILGWSYSGMFAQASLYIPLVITTSALLIINNLLSLADLPIFTMCEMLLIGPLWGFMEMIEIMGHSIAGYNRFVDMVETKSEIVDSENAVELENVKGNILFHDVTFKHEKADKKIFKNLNLYVESGQYIALVGSSGVGKSTLCNLIPRFYDVSSGEILVDGINIKNIKLENLRKNIGFVQQDAFLFSGTILENIRYGKPSATNEEIIKAAKNAYAHNFIMNLPNGYDTQVGQRGARLSGGQKQRLAIARVFLKNPPILIFDEATSSLDNESERFIQKSMEKLAENRTTIVIAHRLSTIKNAKRILVMADGKIAEEGTHEELLSQNGVYAEFYNLL